VFLISLLFLHVGLCGENQIHLWWGGGPTLTDVPLSLIISKAFLFILFIILEHCFILNAVLLSIYGVGKPELCYSRISVRCKEGLKFYVEKISKNTQFLF
jgi:hypothetical protein